MMKALYGWRTFIGTVLAMVFLVIGLVLLDRSQRHTAYVFFAGGIVGALGALAAKSVGTAAVNGEGLKNGLANLLTDRKPGAGDDKR